MTNLWKLAVILLMSGPACAKSTCSDIHGKQSYQSLVLMSGTVCFVQEPVLDQRTGVSTGEVAISLFYIDNGNAPVRAEGRGLLYEDSPGAIVDAFPLTNDNQNDRVAVIHSMNVRESMAERRSSGRFYSVSVFVIVGNALRRDERASDWFGADYSWISDGRNVVYIYPYQTKKDVRQAMDSPFASLMNADNTIDVILKNKSYLFDGPNISNKTQKYLVKGDKGTVDRATAGWCEISYSGGKKPLKMWLLCNALGVTNIGR